MKTYRRFIKNNIETSRHLLPRWEQRYSCPRISQSFMGETRKTELVIRNPQMRPLIHNGKKR